MDNQLENKKHSGLEQAQTAEEIFKQDSPIISTFPELTEDESKQNAPTPDSSGTKVHKDRDTGAGQWPTVSWP